MSDYLVLFEVIQVQSRWIFFRFSTLMFFFNALFIIKYINMINIFSKLWQKLDLLLPYFLCFVNQPNQKICGIWEFREIKRDMLVRVTIFFLVFRTIFVALSPFLTYFSHEMQDMVEAIVYNPKTSTFLHLDKITDYRKRLMETSCKWQN